MRRFFRDPAGSTLTPQGSVVCIGAFDGVHRGHRALLAQLRARAAALGVASAAISFEPVPRQFFQGRDNLPRLSSPREKIGMLLEQIDVLGLLRFHQRLADTSAEAFIADTLVGRLQAREVWVGPGFRFGHGRRGDLALLQNEGTHHGFVAHAIAALAEGAERISSSRIRAALAASEFVIAAGLLGRPFSMSGHVVHGRQLGRQLGYPTANLRIAYGRAPVQGIFAVRVYGAGLRAWPAVASLGTRPTVDGIEPLLEAHLFDFDGDLYGRLLKIEFVAKLRDEARFANLDDLVAQIDRDAEQARAVLADDTAHEGAVAP